MWIAQEEQFFCCRHEWMHGWSALHRDRKSTDQKIFHECSWIIGMKYVGSPGVTLRDKMLHEESQRFVVM